MWLGTLPGEDIELGVSLLEERNTLPLVPSTLGCSPQAPRLPDRLSGRSGLEVAQRGTGSCCSLCPGLLIYEVSARLL